MRFPFDARSGSTVEATTHRHGLVLATIGVLVIVPDATLIRMVGSDSLTTTAFRGALASAALLTALAVRYRLGLVVVMRSAGWLGVVSAILSGATTTLFVFAVDRTSVGNVVMLIATSPLWAALWTRFALGQRIARRTLLAFPVAFTGIAIAVSGSVGQGRLEGDLLALAAAIVVAANLTILRHKHEVDMVPTAAVGNGLAAVAAWGAGASTVVPAGDVVPLLLLGLVVVPLAMALITAGARRLASPETALILLLETALSPIFAWMVIDEPLETRTVVGGALVVATLLAHTLAGRSTRARDGRAEVPADPTRHR